MATVSLVNRLPCTAVKYNITDEKDALKSSQVSSFDDYLDQQQKLREETECILQTQDLLCQKLTSLMSELPATVTFDLLNELHAFKVNSDGIEKAANSIQQQLQDPIKDDKEDLKRKLTRLSSAIESRPNSGLENDIERLKKNVDQLKSQFDEIYKLSQQRRSQEQSDSDDADVQQTIDVAPTDDISRNKRSYLLAPVDPPREAVKAHVEDFATLSHLLVKQVSPSIVDIKDDETDLTDDNQDEKGKLIEVSNSDSAPRINQKIRLSNNIVRWIRGPFRIMVEGTLHMVDLCAQGTRISEAVVRAVQQGFIRQSQLVSDGQIANQLFKPPFAEITSEWEFVGLNEDQGYSSPSIWMKDPQGRRFLVKTQDHALSAVNEWLAYALGRVLDLPINEVQIAVHEQNLVTLHADVAEEDEQTVTFMDLPKRLRKRVITDPLLESMDLFDHIIQNVDRNPRNILITFPKSASLEDENVKLKVHFIDHSPSFGMGKLNGISVVANKFHSNHLAIVKFDPIGKAKKFERYLSKLPVEDRMLIRNTFNRFTAITNEQIDKWITEIQDLLTPSQYNRIHSVLYRQRDIARRYAMQWGIEPRRSTVTCERTKQSTSETDSETTHF